MEEIEGVLKTRWIELKQITLYNHYFFFLLILGKIQAHMTSLEEMLVPIQEKRLERSQVNL
jgi:hypothetical protein